MSTPSPRRPLSPHVRLVAVAAAYLLLTVVMTWPIIGRLGTEIPDVIGDGYVHLWTFDWLKESLASGTNPFFTPRLFFPVGADLSNHNIAWVHFFLWLPLQVFMGGAAAFSLVFLLTFAFNAFAVYLLARRITGSEAAAFIAGLVGGFWPYNVSHHSHPNLIAIGWIPLILLALDNLFVHRRARDAVILGLLVGLLGVTRWQLLILSSILLLMALVYHLIRCPAQQRRRAVLLLLPAGLIATMVMAPFFYPIVRYQVTRSDPQELLIEDEVAYGSDLAAYVLPSRYHPLWGEAVARVTGRLAGNGIYVRSVGYTALALAMLGCIVQWRKARFWLAVAVVYFVLALGATLYVAGAPQGALPYRWLENLFFFQLVRFPDRFNVVLALPVAVLVGLGVAWLRRQDRPLLSSWLPGLSALLILFEYVVAYPMLPLTVPPWHARLAQDQSSGLLDVPMCPQFDYNKRYMLYQLQHGRPLVQGHVSRPSSEMFAFIDSVPLLREINCRYEPPAGVNTVSEQLDLLAAAGIPYLVLHKEYLSPEQLAAWQDWLVIAPLDDDEFTVVYDTSAAGRDALTWAYPMLDGSDGAPIMGLVNATAPTTATQGGQLPIDATWYATEGPGRDLEVCAALGDETAVVAEECSPLSTERPSSVWVKNELVHAAYALPIDPFLAPAEYALSLTLRDPDGRAVGRPAALGQVTVSAMPREFVAPTPAQPEAISWGDSITLVGYDLNTEGDTARLNLYWQAGQPMDAAYKLFVHVIDPAGQLATQEDRAPGNWTRPTEQWAAGEFISDTVELSLAGLPAGEYALRLGWYDPETGQRLPISAGRPDLVITDDAVLLTTIQR